jgi:hypothetical protein
VVLVEVELLEFCQQLELLELLILVVEEGDHQVPVVPVS